LVWLAGWVLWQHQQEGKLGLGDSGDCFVLISNDDTSSNDSGSDEPHDIFDDDHQWVNEAPSGLFHLWWSAPCEELPKQVHTGAQAVELKYGWLEEAVVMELEGEEVEVE
jgi:hypothetical protein